MRVLSPPSAPSVTPFCLTVTDSRRLRMSLDDRGVSYATDSRSAPTYLRFYRVGQLFPFKTNLEYLEA
jgi:hypothetical protein